MPNRAGASSSRTRTGLRPTTDNPPPVPTVSRQEPPPHEVGREPASVTTDTTVVLWQPYFDLQYFVCKSKFVARGLPDTACENSWQLGRSPGQGHPLRLRHLPVGRPCRQRRASRSRVCTRRGGAPRQHVNAVLAVPTWVRPERDFRPYTSQKLYAPLGYGSQNKLFNPMSLGTHLWWLGVANG